MCGKVSTLFGDRGNVQILNGLAGATSSLGGLTRNFCSIIQGANLYNHLHSIQFRV